MKKLNQSGAFNVLIIPTVLFLLTTVVVGFFAFDYYQKYVDAQENVDQKSAVAVKNSREKIYTEIETEFVEKEKEPFKAYQSNAILSSIKFEYPKTWSAMMAESERGSTQIDGTFHPNVIKLGTSNELSYAFRIQLVDRIYSSMIRSYESKVKKGDLVSRVVVVSNVKGVRLDGQISNDDNGSLILLPIRDKTLVLWTESKDFVNDYNKIIDTVSFTP